MTTLRILPSLGLTIGLTMSQAWAVSTPDSTLRSYQSPEYRVPVVELFTSEGCSSCPPADRWLSRTFKSSTNRQIMTLPLSFHVDYWDYIGWKDPYAQAQFTARQTRYKTLGNAKVLYTPQVMVSGQEQRNWRAEQPNPNFLSNFRQQRSPVDIQLTLKSFDTKQVKLSVQTRWSNPQFQQGQLWWVIYEDGLEQNISAGENSGRTLKHDGVVRVLKGPYAVSMQQGSIQGEVAIPANWNTSQLGLGVFIESPSGNEILQALNVPQPFINQTVKP